MHDILGVSFSCYLVTHKNDSENVAHVDFVDGIMSFAVVCFTCWKDY